jgi:amino acid adenylation domain-containing protein
MINTLFDYKSSELSMISPLKNQGIQQLFEEKVEQHPDAIALVFQDQQISYRELNNRANQLANYLKSCGVKPEILVGICLERSIEMVVGLLSILKAGGAYVPLDPTYPKERLALILEDTQLSFLLTQRKLSDVLFQFENSIICLDTDADSIKRHSCENPTNELSPDNLAYIIYTSGSTGKPKGVQITHDNIWQYLRSINKVIQVQSNDIYLHTASFSFSSSVRQLILPLSRGSKIILASYEQIRNPLNLLTIIHHQGVTIFDTVQSVWRYALQALESLEQDSVRELLQSNLRLLIFSGGLLPCQLLKKIRNQLTSQTNIVNVYGQTETIGVCAYPIPEQFDQEEGYVPVGYPFEHIQTYVLDANLQPVTQNEKGELYVEFSGLERGYLNRTELNSEQFISNPFNQESSTKLYKTGDVARYLSNGALEVLGRLDHQVKIREMRIELGEIELTLEQHPNIRQTVAVTVDDLDNEKYIVAYIVPKLISDDLNQTTFIREVKTFLKEKLPEYMQPSSFVILTSLPLTPNGKVDRQALPTPDITNIQLETEFEPPSNPTEEILANIWAKVLNISRVGINDNFFDLGGHSLLVTQVISRCRQAFLVEIPLLIFFEQPTIAELALIIAELKLQETDLLVSQTITPRNKSTNIKLSFAQQRLWILDQLDPNSALYNIQDAVQLIGELHVDVLQQALDAIAKRHEIIRTSYIAENGNPIQVINTPKSIELTTIDLLSYAETEREIQIQKILQQESQRPFNLASDTMLRGCLLQLAPQKNILLLVIHHIAADAWSMGILWEELTQLYQAFLAGQDNPFPELPIQYADFTVWQRAWLSGEVLDQQLQYWKRQLANLNPVLELPTDFSRPLVQSYRGKSQSVPLPEKLSSSLQELGHREGVTLYMLLLAAFQTLLYRYTGQEDILVGSPIAGRNRTEVERLIGFFVNTIVLRTDLSGDPSFRQLLAKVCSTTLEAYSYQDLPFDKLVEELQPERSLAYNPIFQVMFSVEKSPILQREFAGSTARSLPIESKTVKFDLDITVMEDSVNELVVVWNYNTDLFNPSTIERMAGHFQTLLEGIVANPEQSISQLPLLTKSEQEQLLLGWNHRPREYTRECVQHLFEEQTDRTPEAVAILFGQQHLTYRELNSKANQLAHYLRSRGVAADQFVGISVERSLDMIVAILGVLKAGAAYIPLDPAYPSDRLSYMINDADISVILTQDLWRSQLTDHQAEFICLDSDWEKIAAYSQENPIKTNTGENLAYVIYTSGSTGKPKGVMISHQALSIFTQTIISEYQITADDRLLQFASINFDVAVEEIYPSLCTGATLVIRNDEMLSDLQTFFQACEDWQLTVINLPTAYWHDLVAEMTVKDIPLPESLRLVLIGGEKVLPEPVRSWQKYVVKSGKSDRLQLINAYGPTETTVSATLYRVPNTIDINGEVPIGRPLAHLQTYILDPHLQPVPIGVSGELYIGGDSLAKGYLNRLELTNEKFIPNPFSLEAGSRLYKTGDLARYLPDGNIEYLGRIDNQVKIRGFRIELGEIETVLSQHPNIRATVVTAREDSPSDKRLVAYVVADQVQPQITDLRGFLQELLPNYMIPNAFVFLEAMPITPNGKIDYRNLPAPDTSSLQLNTEFVPPSNSMEESLANIWAEVLGINRVGINDNFFDLGGHSLLAIQVISRCRQSFSVEIPLQILFEQPTIAKLGDRIKTLLWLTESQQTNTDSITNQMDEMEEFEL